MSGRRDWAVVLARGESRRMGRPKGACRLPGRERTFLASIAALYRDAGWPLAVVTTPELAVAYTPLLAPAEAPRWILRPPGGGTARTVIAALEELGETATHLWLHPVDLPEVAPRTLRRLAALSRRAPAVVLVPEHAGAPGHPVVLPVAPFLDLRGAAPDGSMRAVLTAAAGPGAGSRAPWRAVPVPDPGVTADHDTPGKPAGLGAETEEEP